MAGLGIALREDGSLIWCSVYATTATREAKKAALVAALRAAGKDGAA